MRVLVTGANRGIGLELCRQLISRGDQVVGTARDPASAGELAATGATVLSLDVTDPASVAALAAAVDEPLDLLVNNAGRGGAGPGIAELDWELVRPYFDVNAVGPMRVVQALLPRLRAGALRRVVQLSTNLASIGDNRSGGLYAYRASKAALNMLTRTLALELAAEGFTCVAVHPGWVQTAMGGPRAPLPVAQAVADLVRLFDRLEPAMTGRFWSHTGDELPW
jgi:NAD(P)-dependent dehydrogenase (short-subunit alcohol dehydrogenase family)